MKETLVTRNVDDSGFDPAVQNEVCESQVECHAAQLLFQPTVRVGPGQRGDESRFTVVDVTRRSHYMHGALVRAYVWDFCLIW
jgi:hypothetical protein